MAASGISKSNQESQFPMANSRRLRPAEARTATNPAEDCESIYMQNGLSRFLLMVRRDGFSALNCATGLWRLS